MFEHPGDANRFNILYWNPILINCGSNIAPFTEPIFFAPLAEWCG
jgi:hypothetical protein